MKKIFPFLALAILSAWLMPANAQNLLQNGSAEYYDTISLAPEAWTSVSGNWSSQDHTGYTADAHDSTHIFYAGTNTLAVLQQDVDVNGYATTIDNSTQYYSFSGWIQSKAEVVPPDQAAFSIQCLDAAKTQVLYNWRSDTTASVGVWAQVTAHFMAPPGTRYLRVQLIAIKNQGSTNDAYFDDIYLSPSTGTGLSNPRSAEIGSISPNPVRNTIELSLNSPGRYHLCITTMNGEVTRQEDIGQSAKIDVSTLPNGIYSLQLTSINNKDFQNIKFIKQ